MIRFIALAFAVVISNYALIYPMASYAEDSTESVPSGAAADYFTDIKPVGSSGDFTHVISFDAPEYRGLVPDIGLRYNSADRSHASVRNLVGFGWKLTGFSMIERKALGKGVPSFEDGSDVFLLDGMELMACRDEKATNPFYPDKLYPNIMETDRVSASCFSGGNMATRVEDYRRILYDSVANTFSVTSKNGTIFLYESLDALVGVEESASTHEFRLRNQTRWLLTEIRDIQPIVNGGKSGNYVEISYGFDTLENAFAHRPKQISYAGYKVKFNYETASKPLGQFATGTTFLGKQYHRLTSIVMTEDENVIRGYGLNYSESDLTSTTLLDSVTEFGRDLQMLEDNVRIDVNASSALPATTFEYSEDPLYGSGAPSRFKTITYPSDVRFPGASQAVDIDFDGDQEFVLWETRTYKNDGGLDKVYPAEILDFEKTEGTSTSPDNLLRLDEWSRRCTPTRSLHPEKEWQSSEYFLKERVTDGFKYYCLYAYSRKLNDDDDYTKVYLRSLGSEFTEHEIDVGWWHWNFNGKLEVVNFDLDASSEVIIDGRLYDIVDGKLVLVDSLSGWWGLTNHLNHRQLDMNGDGQFDYLDTSGDSTGYRIIRPEDIRDSSGSLEYRRFSSRFVGTNDSHDIRFLNSDDTSFSAGYGDVNADGLPDHIVIDTRAESSRDKIYAYQSTGVGFEKKPGNFYSSLPSYEIGRSDVLTGLYPNALFKDFNSDGFVDMLLSGGHFYINTGGEFKFVGRFSGHSHSGDFNGDGIPDLVYHNPSRIKYGVLDIPNRLSAVNTPQGGRLELVYSPTSKFGANEMPGISHVVTELTRFDGRGGEYKTTFDYASHRYDSVNRAAVGWEVITATLPALPGENQGVKIVSSYSPPNVANPHFSTSGHLWSREIFSPDGLLMFQEVNDWEILGNDAGVLSAEGAGPFRVMHRQKQTRTRFGSHLVETTESYEWNRFGEPLAITRFGFTRDGDNIFTKDDTYSRFKYSPNLVDYIVDKPYSKATYKGRDVSHSTDPASMDKWLAFEDYLYDNQSQGIAPTIGRLTKRRVWNGKHQLSKQGVYRFGVRREEEFSYDGYGNIISQKDAMGYETSFEYDDEHHIFLTSRTNALGHVETFVWDTLCQKKASTTDPNLLVSQVFYDNHCREYRRLLPQGTFIDTNYIDLGNAHNQHIRVSRPTIDAPSWSAPDVDPIPEFHAIHGVEEYFDGLGRTYKEIQFGEMGGATDRAVERVTTLREFDARGQLLWESLPMSAAEMAEGVENYRSTLVYDPLGRVLVSTAPDGSTVKTEYLSDITRIFSKTHLPIVKVLDQACTDTDPGSVCGPRYTASDAYGRTVLSWVQDIDGSGDELITEYVYDRLGRLIKVIDPGRILSPVEGEDRKVAKFSYVYDAFGQRISVTDPGLGTWLMDYDKNGNLVRQEDSKGQVIEFAYDALNRPTLKHSQTDPNDPESIVRTSTIYDQIGFDGSYNIGHPTTVEIAGKHSIDYDYGITGAVISETHTIDGLGSYTLTYDQYDTGLPKSMSIPMSASDGSINGPETVGATIYDHFGRIKTVASNFAGTNYINDVTYNSRGQATSTFFANGVEERVVWDPQRGWMDSFSVVTPDGSTAVTTSYTRAASGSVSSIATEEDAPDYSYSYDFAGRMTAAIAGEDTERFTFLPNGSLKTASEIDGNGSENVTTYHYDNNFPVHAPSAFGNIALTYDANGNMIQGIGKTMTYDAENRPIKVVLDDDSVGERTVYTYGADGSRLKKVVRSSDGFREMTWYFGPLEVRGTKDTDGNVVVDQVLAYVTPQVRAANGVTSFIHADQLGSIRAITGFDTAEDPGTLKKSSSFEPFGEEQVILDFTDPEETKGWIGERFDETSGLQYLNARYYDPELGVFLHPDLFDPDFSSAGEQLRESGPS